MQPRGHLLRFSHKTHHGNHLQVTSFYSTCIDEFLMSNDQLHTGFFYDLDFYILNRSSEKPPLFASQPAE